MFHCAFLLFSLFVSITPQGQLYYNNFPLSDLVETYSNGSALYKNGSLIYEQGIKEPTLDFWIILPKSEVIPQSNPSLKGCIIFREEGVWSTALFQEHAQYLDVEPVTVWCNGGIIDTPYFDEDDA